jgi:hypothetical protein
VRLWSLPSGQLIATISLPFVVNSLAVALNKVAIQGPDSIRLYSVKDGSFSRAIDKVGPMAMSFSADGKLLLFAHVTLLGVIIVAKEGHLLNVETGAEYPAEVAERVVSRLPYREQPYAFDCAIERDRIFPDLR